MGMLHWDMAEEPPETERQPDPGRRKDLAKHALDTGFEDPLWLHNLAQCSRFDADAWGDLSDTAEKLRHDAELLEEAHERIDEGELIPAEAAYLIAQNVRFHFFSEEYRNTRDLSGGVPITEEP